MKQYKVTVNGQSYDVSVEEVSGTTSAAPRPVSPVVSAVPTPAANPAPVQEVKASAPSAAPAPIAVVSAPLAGATSVKSPMPGTLMTFKVAVGQDVKRGEVLLILEAMKMENEIVAPQAGKVVALRVASGASVNTGDPLIDLA